MSYEVPEHLELPASQGGSARSVLSSTLVLPGAAAAGVIDTRQSLRVIDTEGAQIADFFAWTRAAPHRHQEMGLTSMVGRWRSKIGDVLVNSAFAPMWTIT
ncbi:DUF1989 domain-containing protein [Streptomyces sp. L7]